MTQRELNEAVALVTGEDITTIEQHGFSDATPRVVYVEADPSDDMGGLL